VVMAFGIGVVSLGVGEEADWLSREPGGRVKMEGARLVVPTL
jgi:hypothetical protein